MIQRVVMRGKRFGVGPAGDRMKHRRFDFQEATLLQETHE